MKVIVGTTEPGLAVDGLLTIEKDRSVERKPRYCDSVRLDRNRVTS